MGKPRKSPQEEIITLYKEDGIVIEKITAINHAFFEINGLFDARFSKITLAENDGLHIDDFNEWFKNASDIEPMAIINFTKFRYA